MWLLNVGCCRRFEAEATAVIAAFDAKKTKRKAFRRHRDPQQSDMDPKVPDGGIPCWHAYHTRRNEIDRLHGGSMQIAHDLAEQARCCQEYAEMNAQALRKIAKKHDKMFGLKTGQQFVQVTLSASAIPVVHHPLST